MVPQEQEEPVRKRKEKEDTIEITNSESPKLQFFSSGCTPLDLVLGGGYPLGRISNIVGDKSTGKTLLAIEACANFNITFPDGKIYYHETEAAFDDDYARKLGMPIEKITFIRDVRTVEDTFEVISDVLTQDNKILWITDSLDAISDKEEMKRKIDEGTYGGNKPKKMSEMFRRIAKDIEASEMHFMIISQLRDKIGATFGRKSERSGGRALDFYASQVLWLAELGKRKKTINKVERKIGIDIKVNCDKNKISMPFRECEIPILFGYGIDDITACLEWLDSVGRLEETGISKIGIENIETAPEIAEQIKNIVKKTWAEIEEGFKPKVGKYN